MTHSRTSDTQKTQRELRTYFTFCPMCGKDADQLVLGLAVRYLDTDGYQLAYGHPGGEVAKYLKQIEKEYDYEVVEEHERLPADDVCKSCQDLLYAQKFRFNHIVAEGGVAWFCDICKQTGVIVANDSLGFCENIRKETKILAPNPVTVKFNDCKQHASAEDVYTKVQ